jgi:nicotinate-nucleotide pyrophosphorylase (carboxylating)
MLVQQTVRDAVRAAIEEDLGPGDVTSQAVVEREARARGRIVARQALVVAGLPVAREVFRAVDPDVLFREECSEGADLAPGQALAIVEGRARSILAAERTALNFLQRMCGIATACRRLVRLAGEKGVQISDTRKTAPGLRALDKYSVRIGGGTNHRAGLFDAVLIKDNHWRLAGGVGEAVRRARRANPSLTAAGGNPGAPGIEVEVGTLAEVEEALAAGADALLLDNMDEETLTRAVALARGRAFLEVSGGVREDDVPRLAAAGVNRISVGALTHSVHAADIALELEAA